MPLLDLLIAILVLVVVLWAVSKLLPLAGLPEPIHTVIYVIIVVLAVLWFAGRLGVGPGLGIG
jgi:hypothetical protein